MSGVLKRPWRRLLCLAIATGMLFAACGSDEEEPVAAPESSATAEAFPVTIDTAAGPVTIEEQPDAIVSLSPTATEMLFAVGAGEQVVAVDDQSDYPPEVPTTDLSGFEPNVEAIVGYEPDLVVASSEASLESLADVGIPLLVQPAAVDLDDTYAQLEQVGTATGHVEEAAEEVATMKTRIDEIVATVPETSDPPTYYHELDNTYFSVTSETFIGQVYGLAGLENIADEAKKAGTGYPQLSAEYIIEANPDFVFLADSECCGQTREKVSKRPGWDQIAAIEQGAVFDVGDDVSSRWGPRVVEFLEIVVDAILEKTP